MRPRVIKVLGISNENAFEAKQPHLIYDMMRSFFCGVFLYGWIWNDDEATLRHRIFYRSGGSDVANGLDNMYADIKKNLDQIEENNRRWRSQW